MEQKIFDTIFPCITAALVERIIGQYQTNEDDAIMSLLETSLYAALEVETTKLWQYSNTKLFDLYKNEIENGDLVLPKY